MIIRKKGEKNRRIELIVYGLIYLLLIIVTFGYIVKDNREEGNAVHFLIGIAHADLSESWQLSLNEEIEEKIKEYKDVQIIVTNANGSTYKQMKDIETLMSYGIDLLIINPNDLTIMRREVKSANEKIPVIVLNTKLVGNDYTMFIGPDYNSIGMKAGMRSKLLLQDESGIVLKIKSDFSIPTADSLYQGFDDSVEDINNTILNINYADDWRTEDLETLIGDYNVLNDVDLILTHNNELALATYEKILEASNEMGNAIDFIGLGPSNTRNTGIDNVKEGKLNTTYTWQLGGKEAIEYGIEILKGENNIPQNLILRNYEITRDNVNEYLNRQKNVPTESDKKIKIGYIQSSMTNQWQSEETQSILEEALKKDIPIILNGLTPNKTASENHDEQIMLFNKLIDEEIEIIILSPILKDGWEKALKRAKESNIPVIILDNPLHVSDDVWSTYIGYNSEDEGNMAAKWIIDNLYTADADIKISELMIDDSSYSTEKRSEIFNLMIAGYSRIGIEKFEIKDDSKDVKELIEKIVEDHGEETKILFAHDESIVLEALEVLKKYDKKHSGEIVIIGIGGPEKLQNALAEGEITCIIERDPKLGPLLFRYVNNIIEQKELPEYVINGNRYLTSTNDGN